MNARSALRSVLGPGFFVLSLGLGMGFVAGCGPKEPPRQASLPDPPDPDSEATSASSSSSSSSSSPEATGAAEDPLAKPPPGGKVAVGKGGDAPQVGSLAAFLEGVKWGTTHTELTKQFTQTGGVIWKDYDEKLAKARVGPEQTALEAERERAKNAFSRSYIEFKDTPTGYDTTGLAGEYTYKNKESLMWIERKGKKRYFFFINDRLWKIYDEVLLAEGGPLGAAYLDAVNKLNEQLNAQGRVQQPDPAKGIRAMTVDWKDGANRLRAVDRSSDKVVGLVVEESATLANIAALRPNKMADPTEIDPSIAAVTGGANRVDPNAPSTAPSASASGKKPAPKPKKK